MTMTAFYEDKLESKFKCKEEIQLCGGGLLQEQLLL